MPADYSLHFLSFDGKARQFVAEGRLVVERLIDDGRCTIHSLLVSPSADDSALIAR